MAYTITQKPTTPNAAYTRLMYVVSGSTNTAKPQFQYVMDVYESGSTDLIKRNFSPVNPAGVSVFDPSRIIQGRLKEEFSWDISYPQPYLSSSKTFTLKFGETYATSISSSAAIIDDVQQTNTEVFRGVVEPNAGAFDWDSSSYAVLSNMPATMSMQENEYLTIGVYNNSVNSISSSLYSGSTKINEINYNISDKFTTVPLNLLLSGSWNYAEVNVSSSIGTQSYRYEAKKDDCREKVRFAFINKLGSWDYFTNFNPVREVIEVEREQYTAARVDYSSLTSTYDISRRGVKDYHNSTDNIFTVDTDYLDKENANWLEELIESPSVYIQRNPGDMIPIIITDSSYTANTNQARQKVFKYTINFKPANQPFGNWIPEYESIVNEAVYDFKVRGVSPIYWWDFTESYTGNLRFSSGNEISEIQSKGQSQEILRTITAQGQNKPTFDSINRLSFFSESLMRMNAFDTGSYFANDFSNPGFPASKDFTLVSFIQPNFVNATSASAVVSFSDSNTAAGTSQENYVILTNSGSTSIQDESAYYGGRTDAILNMKAIGFNSGQYYSYSGSSDTSPWHSQFFLAEKTSGSALIDFTQTRDTTQSFSGQYSNGTLSNSTYFTLGQPANGDGEGILGFAHVLLYDFILSDAEMQEVIETFKNSLPYGWEVNPTV